MSTDAIVLLKQQHKEIKKLFRDFQATDAKAMNRRGDVVRQMLEALTVHTYLENEVMYPEVRQLLPDLEENVLEAYEEHHVADVLCFELATMRPEDEHFEAKVTVLADVITNHIDEEEHGWFPKVREKLGRKQLQEMGARMAELEPKAPRKPTEPKALKTALMAMRA